MNIREAQALAMFEINETVTREVMALGANATDLQKKELIEQLYPNDSASQVLATISVNQMEKRKR
ncbi:MAG TPA: hypothetical protein VLH19_05350 [Patescibacteria group bacterium]|nr:hypothetical protein [Patescibacteria group bacterium]